MFNAVRLLHLALLLALPFTAAAQTTPASDKDRIEFEHVVLTIENVTDLYVSTHDLSQLVAAQPALARRLSAGSSDQQSISAAEHRLASEPAVVSVLASHHLSARQYVLVEHCYLGTAVAASMAAKLGVPPSQLVTDLHLNPVNLAFLGTHKAELDALNKKYPMDATD